MSYLDSLGHELAAVGIKGRRRSRILAEFADHLRCDPAADLGTPTQVAQQFADELGTRLALRAARNTFAALAVAGVLYAVAFLSQAGGLKAASGATPPLGDLAAVIVVLAPQLAFVVGVLAVARAVRLRRDTVVPRAEATIIVRRAEVGLAAGLASMVGFALLAVALNGQAAGWWVALTLSISGVGTAALLAAAPSVLAAAKVRPVREGPSGGLFDDLGSLASRLTRGRPWRFALATAASVAIGVTAAGVLQADPYDGALRGLADGLACLAGFLVLGRYLGLRD